MKALLEDVSAKKGQDSFMAYAISTAKFDFIWHYHPEYELTLILEGHGRRLVGDSHENFDSGDLVLLGPGLPHTWVSDFDPHTRAAAVVIQFSEGYIEAFSKLYELKPIHKLLQLAKRGICFPGKIPAGLVEQIKQLPKNTGVEKICGLLYILQALGSLSHTSLATALYQPMKGKENENRINIICQFVQNHATESIDIHKAAALIHLSPVAFCKFFKRISGKTFSDYVNAIRIANICSELIATDKQIAEVAYANGFETLTYFNRVFLKKKGITPKQYRLQKQ